MGRVPAADPELLSDVAQRFCPAVRRERRRPAPRLQLRGLLELSVRGADPHGGLHGRPAGRGAARGAPEAPSSTTQGGGADVRRDRGGRVRRDVRGLDALEETPRRRRAGCLPFNHSGVHH